MADPNADLIGYHWHSPGETGMLLHVVTETHPSLPQYVRVEVTHEGLGSTITLRPAGVVRRHKQLTEGGQA